MSEPPKTPNHSAQWLGLGTGIGAAVFVVTDNPAFIAVGVAIGAALSYQKSNKPDSRDHEDE